MPLKHINPSEYRDHLNHKIGQFKQDFATLNLPEISVFESSPLHYRMRAEFRMFHHGDRVDYAMFAADAPKKPVIISEFPIAAPAICRLMPRLREAVQGVPVLKQGLFQVDFLASVSGQLLVTLVYHRALGEDWESAARKMASELDVLIVGRSRKQKVVLQRDWLEEVLEVDGRHLRSQQVESSFTQPNAEVNRKMLSWARTQCQGAGGDLLELYCGNGNFTLALAPLFRKVLATEVSKTSVKAAEYGLAENRIENVTLVRMSSDEISRALTRTEVFRRMADVDLNSYAFSTLFVDPPRAGLDEQTLALARGFDRVLYISCNPQTLRDNVMALQDTHQISAAAAFDQFPYTHHLEAGLLLTRRQGASASS